MMANLLKNSAIFCACFMFCVSLSYAQNTKAPSQAPQPVQKTQEKKTEKKYNVEDFTYVSEGTRNPFMPILLLKAKTSRGMSVRTSKDKKEAPEKMGYELEALRLVGVIKSDKGMIAMMEDTQGKGIFFKKGDHLNKNMWVIDVTTSNVVLGYKTKGETKKLTVDIPKN